MSVTGYTDTERLIAALRSMVSELNTKNKKLQQENKRLKHVQKENDVILSWIQTQMDEGNFKNCDEIAYVDILAGLKRRK